MMQLRGGFFEAYEFLLVGGEVFHGGLMTCLMRVTVWKMQSESVAGTVTINIVIVTVFFRVIIA